MKLYNVLRVAAGAMLAAAIAGSALFLPKEASILATVETIQGMGVWGPVLWACLYLVTCTLMLPSSPLTVGAGFLFGLPVGTAVASLGGTLGATTAFLVGRTLAHDVVERWFKDYPRLQALDRAVRRRGFKIVLLTRLSPLFPFNVFNYALALTKVLLRDYLSGSLLGMLPGTFLFVYFGTTAQSLTAIAQGEIEAGTAKTVFLVVGLLATVALTVLAARIGKRALDEEMQRPQESSDAPPGETADA